MKALVDRILKPSIINDTALAYANVSTITVTPPVTPTAGKIMFIAFGGITTVTITSVPSGWAAIPLTTLTGEMIALYWKVATGSEPANYVFNFNTGIGGGHWRFFQMDNMPLVPLASLSGSNSGSNSTTISAAPYDIPGPGWMIVFIIPGISGTVTIDNSFVAAGSAGSFKIYYRLYGRAFAGEVTTVAFAGTSLAVSKIFLKGLQLN